MRTLVTLLIVLGIIVGLGFWANYSLEESACDLIAQIDKVAAEIKGNRWTEATNHVEELEKVWSQKASWWPIILDHTEIDNIEFSLAKVKEYVANQHKPLSLGQLSELKLMIEHIPRKEAITLENVM